MLRPRFSPYFNAQLCAMQRVRRRKNSYALALLHSTLFQSENRLSVTTCGRETKNARQRIALHFDETIAAVPQRLTRAKITTQGLDL